MERNDYTVIVFKKDKRVKGGEREVKRIDHTDVNLDNLMYGYAVMYPLLKGYRCEFKETYVTRVNMMSGKEFKERFDTPIYCSPAFESYWCM